MISFLHSLFIQQVRDVVSNARAVHANIIQTKQNLIDATAETETRSPLKLQRAIEGARVLGWTNPKVDEAIAREAVVTKACNAAHAAWQQLDRRVIQVKYDDECMWLCTGAEQIRSSRV